MDDQLILRNKLREIRIEKKLSQAELAEMVGVSRNTISSIETGQFSPTANGTIYQDPSDEAIIASKMAMDGVNVVGDSLFFLNPSIASSRWFDRNCTFYTKIGQHSFYTCDYYADGF